MSRRLTISLGGLVVVAAVLAELLLHPQGDDRWKLVLILLAPAIAALALTPLLSRWVASRASVVGVALTVGLCSLTLSAVATSAASNAMFVSSYDYRLFLVVLLMSTGVAGVVGSQLARPLARDVIRLGQVAQQVAGGDLSVRTGISRRDEVGTTARAIDRMVETLAAAEAERIRLASARQHLFTSIGHDLRTPLSAMRAGVEILQDDLAPDPARYLHVLAVQVADMDKMLDQLVEFSRLESGHSTSTRSRIALAELADECAETLGPLAHRRGISINVAAHSPGLLTASPMEMTRLIRNLVDNAIRHSPDDGVVSVAITNGDGSVHLSVTDGGTGFPAAFRPHAFEPFRRADPARNARTGHAGLGLAICKAIVEAHDGSIALGGPEAGDGPGHGDRGAVVLVSLPAATERGAR